MSDSVVKPSRPKRAGAILAAAGAVVAVGALAYWYGPWNRENRYRRASFLSLQQIVDSNPKDQLAWRQLGLRLAHQGDGAMAEPALREAFALDPSDAEVATGLGEILLATGRLPEAFQVLRAAVEHNPGFALAHMALGRLYMRRGSYHHAADEFKAVVKTDKTFSEAWSELAVCHLQMQQSADARLAIAEAIRLEPNEARYLALKSSIDAVVGATDDGIETARRAAELAPTDVKVMTNYVNILLAHFRGPEDLSNAERAIAKLEEIAPDLRVLPYQKGELERRRQNWAAAQKHLELAAKLSPYLDEVSFSLSQVYRRLGKIAMAEKELAYYNRRQKIRQEINEVGLALGSRPEDEKLHLKLAELHLQAGNPDEALGTLKNGLQIVPGSEKLRKRFDALSAQVTAPPDTDSHAGHSHSSTGDEAP